MKSSSAGNVKKAPDDPVPHFQDVLMDLSALDSLIDESAPPATRAASIADRSAIATVRPRRADVTKALKATMSRRYMTPSTLIIELLSLFVIAEGVMIALLLLRRPAPVPPPDSAAFVVETVPAGARVLVDDVDRGVAPLTLTLPAGSHRVALMLGSERREITLDAVAGRSYARHVEFPTFSPPTPVNGAVEIRTRPSGASVVIAGQARGKTPVTVRDLPPGNHDVLLSLNEEQVRETVTVQSGVMALLSAAFPATSPDSGSGWIALSSPIELTIIEHGQVIGTTRSPRIMMPAGRHTLEIVNERLAFRASRTVVVEDRKTVAIALDLPRGSISVNALPWAEVWLQDRKIGDTPFANLSLTIGTHQLTFRHPSFGERRQEVTITAGAATRVSVDMRR